MLAENRLPKRNGYGIAHKWMRFWPLAYLGVCIGCAETSPPVVRSGPDILHDLTELEVNYLPAEARQLWPVIRTGSLLGKNAKNYEQALSKADVKLVNRQSSVCGYTFFLGPEGDKEGSYHLFVIVDVKTGIIIACGVSKYCS